MHMSDALLSPVVGGIFWVASAGTIGIAAKKISAEDDIAKTPLMGVMGAFIFAAQMINFAIPGTGSSGHIGGGLLLAVLLGPWRAFLTLASVLVVQCLFFADGGLLALGCNIFNLAFFPSFIAYPFIFKPLIRQDSSVIRLLSASLCAAVVSLQLGAFTVVIQTVISGTSDLPFTTFVLFMQPVHLAIGLVEGIVTWGVISFVQRIQPSLIAGAPVTSVARPVTLILTIAALVIGGVLSSLASSSPDGLEWSIAKVTGGDEPEITEGIASTLQDVQKKTAVLPDYSLPTGNDHTPPVFGGPIAGVTGTVLVLFLALVLGFIVRKRTANPKDTDT